MSTSPWNFRHTYAQLPALFYKEQAPTAVADPQLVLWNSALAKDLNLKCKDPNTLASVLGGNEIPPNAKPIAQAYAGHQFGHFTKLGDGRAILLGEHSVQGHSFDIQLKGAGQTPFSRRGDGRATLKAMCREYLMSEAMYALGIPTSRSLAVVATGENVQRETPNPGAVLTRVMKSHIRVGTFEYAVVYGDTAHQRELLHYTIQRHYPELEGSENPALELLKTVLQKQIELVVDWMRVGFIHGVMNTDNVSIAGQTFDYGPCSFMNAYHPETVFSSIDRNGRYAYQNQPGVLQWNMAIFAESLVTLIDPDKDKATEMATEVIQSFKDQYIGAYFNMMARKLGLPKCEEADQRLVKMLLAWMEKNQADYTNTFNWLQETPAGDTEKFERDSFKAWQAHYQQRLAYYDEPLDTILKRMRALNPYIIPRNHVVEDVLNAAEQGNTKLLSDWLKHLGNPYTCKKLSSYYTEAPAGFDDQYQTFCGT